MNPSISSVFSPFIKIFLVVALMSQTVLAEGQSSQIPSGENEFNFVLQFKDLSQRVLDSDTPQETKEALIDRVKGITDSVSIDQKIKLIDVLRDQLNEALSTTKDSKNANYLLGYLFSGIGGAAIAIGVLATSNLRVRVKASVILAELAAISALIYTHTDSLKTIEAKAAELDKSLVGLRRSFVNQQRAQNL